MYPKGFGLRFIGVVSMVAMLLAHQVRAQDSDFDGIEDAVDNCNAVANGPGLTNQLDADQDGYGNACDGDYNNDGYVTTLDFGAFLACYSGSTPNPIDPLCSESDMDGDGDVDGDDFTLFLGAFPNAMMGASGLQCAGSIPCAPCANAYECDNAEFIDVDYLPGAQSIVTPAYADPLTAPVVRFDMTRGNALNGNGYLYPLAQLLRADGYRVEALTIPAPAGLAATAACYNAPTCPYLDQWNDTDIFVVGSPTVPIHEDELIHLVRLAKHSTYAISSGGPLGQVNLNPDFSPANLNVRHSLYVVEDTAAIDAVLTALDVTGAGEPVVDAQGGAAFVYGPGVAEGLADNEIRKGNASVAEIIQVFNPGGQSVATPGLIYPVDFVEPLLTLPAGAATVPGGANVAGQSQAVAFTVGQQRIIVVTSRAMLTALAISDGSSITTTGITQSQALDNEQFALNLFRWLDGTLFDTAAPNPVAGCTGQCGNSGVLVSVPNPAYGAGTGPTVTIDHGHVNYHRIDGVQKRFNVFKEVVEADGYQVTSTSAQFSTSYFSAQPPGSVLVIAGARGSFAAPEVFNPSEVDALLDWVYNGGKLLIAADHKPYSVSYTAIMDRLGISIPDDSNAPDNGGVAVYPTQCSTWITPPWGVCRTYGFYMSTTPTPWQSAMDANHPVVQGRAGFDESVNRVFLARGIGFQISGPPLNVDPSEVNIQAVAVLPASAHYFTSTFHTAPVPGYLSALSIEYGSGRIFVQGETSALTGQVSNAGTEKASVFGIGARGREEHAQFVLNIMHWLDGLIP